MHLLFRCLPLVASLFLPPAATAASLLINGDFETATQGFSSGYTQVLSPESSPTLYAEGTYALVEDVNLYHSDLLGVAASGSRFMAVNGATSPNTVLWSETVAVVPGSRYIFSGWVSSLIHYNLAALEIRINGVWLGEAVLPMAVAGAWTGFAVLWNAASSNQSTITLTDLSTLQYGNDFGLDGLQFQMLELASQVSVAAVPEPAPLMLIAVALVALTGCRNSAVRLRVRLESHSQRALRRSSSMTEAA